MKEKTEKTITWPVHDKTRVVPVRVKKEVAEKLQATADEKKISRNKLASDILEKAMVAV